MDLALSSRIKAIFTKVFCTFFTSLLPPISGAICRPTGALLRSTRFRERIHTKRPLIPTFLSNDNEVERRFAERARNQITPPRPGFSIQVRYFNLQLQMEAQRHGKQTRYASFFPPSLPFPFNFDLYFKNSVQSSILYSSPFHSFYSSDLSKIPFDRYHSTTLFLPSFLIYSHFSVIRITLFQIYPDRRPNFSSIFLSLSRISLLQRFLSNHFSPFFLFPSSIYFYLCSIISIF